MTGIGRPLAYPHLKRGSSQPFLGHADLEVHSTESLAKADHQGFG